MSAGPSLQPAAPELVIATNNAAKLTEFARLLSESPWRLRSLEQVGFSAEIEEPGPKYADNALAKAAAVSSAVGLAALGDDSGIEIEALHGWPGPASARWLGVGATDEERMLALLADVQRRTPGDRHARYVCALALCRPGAEPVVAHGECHGTIVEPRGMSGFGYDPIFLSDDLGVTFGEAAAGAKDRVSHRAHALRRLGESGVLDPQVGAA
ncbi:MAG TPA: non-canonical purine NTP pyrophosphatase [Candidatus Dormibacteraeota bacterium]